MVLVACWRDSFAMSAAEEQTHAVVIRSGEGPRLEGRPSTVTLKIGVEHGVGFSMAVFEAARGAASRGGPQCGHRRSSRA